MFGGQIGTSNRALPFFQSPGGLQMGQNDNGATLASHYYDKISKRGALGNPTTVNKVLPGLVKRVGAAQGVASAVQIYNRAKTNGDDINQYYIGGGSDIQHQNKLAQRANISYNNQAKRYYKNQQLIQKSLTQGQAQQYVPQVVRGIISSATSLGTSGFGPIKNKGSIFYVGRYIDPKTGGIKILPKASKAFINPFSYNDKKHFLQAKIIQNWNQFIKDQQEYYKLGNTDPAVWQSRQIKRTKDSLAGAQNLWKYISKIQNIYHSYLLGKTKPTNITAQIVSKYVTSKPDAQEFLGKVRVLKGKGIKKSAANAWATQYSADILVISNQMQTAGRDYYNMLKNYIVPSNATLQQKSQFQRKYGASLASITFGSLKNVAATVKKLGKSLLAIKTDGSQADMKRFKQQIKGFNRTVDYNASVARKSYADYKTQVAGLFNNVVNKANQLGAYYEPMQKTYNQGQGFNYFNVRPKYQAYNQLQSIPNWGQRDVDYGDLNNFQFLPTSMNMAGIANVLGRANGPPLNLPLVPNNVPPQGGGSNASASNSQLRSNLNQANSQVNNSVPSQSASSHVAANIAYKDIMNKLQQLDITKPQISAPLLAGALVSGENISQPVMQAIKTSPPTQIQMRQALTQFMSVYKDKLGPVQYMKHFNQVQNRITNSNIAPGAKGNLLTAIAALQPSRGTSSQISQPFSGAKSFNDYMTGIGGGGSRIWQNINLPQAGM